MSEKEKEMLSPESGAEAPQAPAGKKEGGRVKYALLGLLISVLSIVGAVSVVSSIVAQIAEATDTTYLHDELYYYLEPLLYYVPEPFESGVESDQDAFLNAAAYRVMNAEQIRMLREKDESCAYAVDDNGGRIVVPAEEITASYRALFGPQSIPNHRTLESSGLEYDESDDCYYVPFQTPTTMERPIIVSVDVTSTKYYVRIGFVPTTDIRLDEYGREMTPTEDMATHFKTFTLQLEEGDTYYIKSCTDE